MRGFRGTRRSAAVGRIVGATAMVLGCSSTEEPPAEPCPREQAAFRLEVTAESGALPDDLAIVVRYQGSQQEEFRLTAPPQNEDVCCQASAVSLPELPPVACPGRGAPEGGVSEAVHCELWTSGVAEVTVTGGDYPDLVETLQAVMREDECGLETTPVRLMLAYPDGGS